MSVISLSHISKSFATKPKPLVALADITLAIEEGEICVFIGPSGCGKSTLLRIMSGLDRGYEGTSVFGEGMTQRDIGFVFQQFALLPWLTVFQNVALPLIARKVPVREIHHRVTGELTRRGLKDFAKNYPHELSGGMRQRVGIARALITEPKILFMDEPFSELDSFTAEELRHELLGIWQERKFTVILVTHNITEAVQLGDRIAVFTPRPGRVEKILVNILPRPRTKRSEGFYKLEDEIAEIIKP